MLWFFLGLLFFAGPAPVTWSHDVAPILYQNCASCHRPGGVAPFSLLTYGDAARRASLIGTVASKHVMPPWLPVEPHFANERKLTAAQIATLVRWADSGAAEGNPAAAPNPPAFPDGWQLGKPDVEAAMTTSFAVPADGPDLYRCFAIPAPATTAHY